MEAASTYTSWNVHVDLIRANMLFLAEHGCGFSSEYPVVVSAPTTVGSSESLCIVGLVGPALSHKST